MKNYQVKEGYKLTEVGVIPEDWDCLKIKNLVEREIIDKPLDGNHGNIHPKKKDFVDNGIPFIMANDVYGGKVHLDTCNFIRYEQAEILQKGFSLTEDILLTHKGTIGNTAIVGKIFTPYIMLTPQVTYYRVRDKKSLDYRYLKHYFDGEVFQKILFNLSGGGTRAYIGITKQINLPIVLPPTIAEQEKIAEALSDVDALIESLEGLIAKKRLIKQGTMQDLLSGQIRIKNGELRIKNERDSGIPEGYKQTELGIIPEDWNIKTIKSIAPLQRGFDLPSSQLKKGSYPVVYSNGIMNYHTEFMVKAPGVVTGRSGTIGNIHYIQRDYWPHNTALWVTNFNENSSKYIYYLYQNIHLERFGSGSGVPTLNRNDVHDFFVVIPPLAEQEKIAEVLTDMDNEITALEEKLNKNRQIKQGMMQELLTGRIRLIDNS